MQQSGSYCRNCLKSIMRRKNHLSLFIQNISLCTVIRPTTNPTDPLSTVIRPQYILNQSANANVRIPIECGRCIMAQEVGNQHCCLRLCKIAQRLFRYLVHLKATKEFGILQTTRLAYLDEISLNLFSRHMDTDDASIHFRDHHPPLSYPSLCGLYPIRLRG